MNMFTPDFKIHIPKISLSKPVAVRRAAGLLSAAVVCGACAALIPSADAAQSAIPTTVELKSGVTVYQNAKASVDASNLSEGFVMVKYTGGKMSASRYRSPRPAAPPTPITSTIPAPTRPSPSPRATAATP